MVRHLAWLNAVPEGSKKRRREELKEDSIYLNLPEIGDDFLSERLASLFLDLGFYSQSGLGPTTFTWSDLKAFQDVTQIEISPIEIFALRELSQEYLNQLELSKKKTCIVPGAVELPTEEKRRLIAEAMKRGRVEHNEDNARRKK